VIRVENIEEKIKLSEDIVIDEKELMSE